MTHCGACSKSSSSLHFYSLKLEKIVSLPTIGCLGIQNDNPKDIAAMSAATAKTDAGENSQTYPSKAGKATAPI
jgi:hypothetical protein